MVGQSRSTIYGDDDSDCTPYQLFLAMGTLLQLELQVGKDGTIGDTQTGQVKVYEINTVSPKVQSVSSSSLIGSYKLDDSVQVKVNFWETVT